MIQEDMNMRKERIEALAIEPFATMVHNDFWVNNMMFKYEQYSNETNNLKNEEIPIAIKFIDFQITIYESPVRDLLFFLFTSSEDGLIDKYFDHLINLYHMKFITVLKTFDCDITPFSYKHFQEEINTIAPREFMHILYLLNPISADSENMEDISNFDKDSLVVYSGGDVYKNKVRCLIKSYGARGWLQ
ncbi:hypothetical protein L9F63_026323 [Diploptera punctata]|uniref:CHK kinase-like domain-containing protein n=1 Tax=Diploptera punctata TaxID=6984 RepID=A0AAD8AKR8_DIPPU|nr:hypothetical protein L9F63_026323 [Diploptera punctata]